MNTKTFEAIEKLKEVELELHRLKNALEMADKALDAQPEQDGKCKHCTDGCPACDARKLPEQEPVAFINVEQRKLEWAKYVSWDTPTVVNLPKIPLYTTPPQRTWVSMTNEQFLEACKIAESGNYMVAFQRIQQWLKENNT